MSDDDQNQQPSQNNTPQDEDTIGETSPSGQMSEDVQDVDDTETSVGLPTDTPQGPTELGLGEAVNNAEEEHQEED